MSKAEMSALGWDALDVLLVTGDAYVDHPSFGAALIGRLLEAHGFRIGILAQPDWQDRRPFEALGRPALFIGITSGNMDSMVNRYTSDGRLRSNDAYSPDDRPGLRPDRAAIVYAQRCREAFPGVPIVLGGIEASLRRLCHYDYWSDLVRRSILLDAKADLLLYGNAERAVLEVARRLRQGEPVTALRDIRGSVFACPAALAPAGLVLPSYDEVRASKRAFAKAECAHQEAARLRDRPVVQLHGDRAVVELPPPAPLAPAELDAVYELSYSREPHPAYAGARLTAWEMIRWSVAIVRGCFGGCTFCALACHEGPEVQSRSEESILREIAAIARCPGFTGVISDLGGPTANMYRMTCQRASKPCRRLSCLFPDICPKLDTDHALLIQLYQKARAIPGVRKVLIGSGVRHDLALRSPAYIRELAQHHVGGYLKVAPEHTAPDTLRLMAKPPIEAFLRFEAQFERFSREAGLEQYLIPYFIAAHPGSRDEDMAAVALWLREHDYRPEQVQTFLPTPMTLATAMYHTGLNPLTEEDVHVPRGLRARRLQKAFLRYHDPSNWQLLRQTLTRLGLGHRIGSGRDQIAPLPRPSERPHRPEGRRRPKRSRK